MKVSFKFILLLFAIGFANPAEAQFLKKFKKAVEKGAEDAVLRKSEQEAEKKTEEMIDDMLNSKEEEDKKKREADGVEGEEREGGVDQEDHSQDVNAMLQMFSGEKVDTKDQYSFKIMATMNTESYDGETEKHVLKQGYGDNCIYTGIDNMETPIIHDFENEAMILLNDSKKEAQVMSLSWMSQMGANVEAQYADDNAVTVRKTGKTKTILKYHCEEYEISHRDGKMMAWFAPKVDFNFDDSFNGFSKIFKTTVNPSLFEKNGYTMSMTVYDKEGKKQSHMEVVDLDQSGLEVDLKGYKVKNMFEK